MLLRDLEELRSKRIVIEDPEVEGVETLEAVSQQLTSERMQEIPEPMVKQEPEVIDLSQSDNKEAALADISTATKETPRDSIIVTPEPSHPLRVPSPPTSSEVKTVTGPDMATATTSASTIPASLTSVGPDNSIDSLFDMTDDANANHDNTSDTSDLDFAMEFLNDNNTTDTSQTQNNEFDLSTFGNTHDFGMADLQGSVAANTSNTEINTDDLFNIGTNSGGGSMMDADTLPAEENSFDDMFFTGDEPAMGGANFDDDFFGLNDESQK